MNIFKYYLYRIETNFTNFNIPDLLVIGKSVSIGFGAIKKMDRIEILKKINEIEKGLEAVHSNKINDMEKATLLLHMSRTIVSINLYLKKQLTQKELDGVLSRTINYQKIRKAKKGAESLDKATIENTVTFIKQQIKNVKEKIKEKDSGAAKTSRTSQTRIF